jgi:prepilin-type N-terminal cleavage/methylation domain-containing protein
MKASLKAGASLGFTIVEVMVVLAISGLILFSAILIFDGQQGKTEFSQAVNQFQTQIQATINDATNGYYPSNSRVECQQGTGITPNGGPQFSMSANAAQGTNLGCIFLGKVMQFAVSSSGDTSSPLINIYTIVGNESVTPGSSILAQSLNDANPVILAPTSSGTNYFPEPSVYNLEYGASIRCIEYTLSFNYSVCNPSSASSTGAVAFAINSSGSTSANGQEVTASSVVPLPHVALGDPGEGMPNWSSTDSSINGDLPNGANAGVYICLSNGNQSAIISVGVNSNQPIVSVNMRSSGDCQ